MAVSIRSLQGSWYKEPTPKEGDLRVYCIVNPPDAPYFHAVLTRQEAMAVIDREANIQLKDPAVGANVFGLQVFCAPGERLVGESDAELSRRGDWEEWEDEDGYTIDDHMNAGVDDYAARMNR